VRKKFLGAMCFVGVLLTLASCKDENGTVFKGDGEKWRGELMTTYDFWGKESQRIRVQYKGENLEQLKENEFIIESKDFFGWGIGNIQVDHKGFYDSGKVIEQDAKTPLSSTIQLVIKGNESETITLSSSY